MTYSVEGVSLRTLGYDDVELTSRYEKANRAHLQPWEPARDEEYFTIGSARARVEQQVQSVQAEGSIFPDA
ncbi:hypothetical protein [Pseudomonas sp. Z18(2022)]|uniref:hypothetical protein n=1 Tax=Pseudomonas sp. Z18(2022) TaxID=2983410 RepID=UPI003FA6B3F1